MKARSPAWFTREVKKAVEKDPTKPVRVDIYDGELSAVSRAFDTLQGPLPFTSNDPDAKRKLFEYWREDRPCWHLWRSDHIDPAKRAKGMERIAFFPPSYAWPEPVDRVLIATVQETIKKKLKTGPKARRERKRLQVKHGPEYHIEITGENGVGGIEPGLYCRRWRGEDWLRFSHACFYPSEIAECLSANVGAVRQLEPWAYKGRRWGQGGIEHIQRMNEIKVEKADRLKAFIREKYQAMTPRIKSGELRVCEAYYEIQDMVARRFDDLNSDDHDKQVSFSTIDRALGKKDTKRKKK